MMDKYNILKSSLFVATIFLMGCSDKGAQINQSDLNTLQQSTYFNQAGLAIFAQMLNECGGESLECQSKVTYQYYDGAYKLEGFSQIQTMINFSNWSESLSNSSLTREKQALSLQWGKALTGGIMCLHEPSCVEWLVQSGQVTEADLSKLSRFLSE
ncbi:hypothetical protein ACVBIO_18120 [Shewanella sp. 0m-8]